MFSITKEQFIEKAQKFNPDIIFDNINYTKLTDQLEVECKNHHKFTMKASSFYSHVNCPICDLKNRADEFLIKAREIHGDKYDYSKVEYKWNKTPVCIICPEHGEFWQTPAVHKLGYGCDKCSGKYKPTTEEWIERAANLYGGKYDLSEVNYIDNKTPVKIICPEHGAFYPTPNNYMKGYIGCPKCRGHWKHDRYKKSTESYIEECNKVHNNKYDYKNCIYYNNKSNVIITCPKHGDFIQNAATHLNGGGCPKCKLIGQTHLYDKLKNDLNDVLVEFERSPQWLGIQRFDIYLPKYNIAIEYDGPQHQKPFNIYGGEEKFLKTIQWDKRKEEKCRENNCILFRIAWDYKKADYDKLLENIKQAIKSRV